MLHTGIAVNVSLISDLMGSDAYHGQRITFKCTVVVVDHDNNMVITWSSDDYIGTRDLQLRPADPMRHTATSPRHRTTVATLINSTHSNGVVTAISELKLIASSRYRTSHVGCRANRLIRPNMTTFSRSS